MVFQLYLDRRHGPFLTSRAAATQGPQTDRPERPQARPVPILAAELDPAMNDKVIIIQSS
jgi:hypothetical protein